MAAMNDLDLSRAMWKKSSFSNNGGACVEVTHASVRLRNAGTGNGADCAGTARRRPAVAVRDSKDPDGPVLSFSAAAWHAFATSVK